MRFQIRNLGLCLWGERYQIVSVGILLQKETFDSWNVELTRIRGANQRGVIEGDVRVSSL